MNWSYLFDEAGWLLRSLQTFITWPVVILILAVAFHRQIKELASRVTRVSKEGIVFFAVENLKLSEYSDPVRLPANGVGQKSQPDASSYEPPSWHGKHLAEYQRTRGYALAHVIQPSSEPDQKYEVSVFVARHRLGSEPPPQTEYLDEVRHAEFFFGPSWRNRGFPVDNSSLGIIGVRLLAWGSFFASCNLEMTDGSKIMSHRFVDFFRPPAVVEAPLAVDAKIASG